MKIPTTFNLSTLALIILFTACNNKSGSETMKSDSSGVTAKTQQQLPPSKMVFSTLLRPADFVPGVPPRQIPRDMERTAEDAYRNHPVIFDENSNPVAGYMLEKGDFQLLKNLKGISNIYIKFGVKGSKEVNGQTVYEYTMIIVPVDKDNNTLELNKGYSALDFVCPCVNGQGCCPKPVQTAQ